MMSDTDDINKYFGFFEDLEVELGYLEERRDYWVRESGNRITDSALIWKVSNDLILKYDRCGDYSKLKALYIKIASMHKHEGKKFFGYLQEAYKMDLFNFRKALRGRRVSIEITACKYSPPTLNLNLGNHDTCPACSHLIGVLTTIDEALKEMPLPVKGCTRDGGCCKYTVHAL